MIRGGLKSSRGFWNMRVVIESFLNLLLSLHKNEQIQNKSKKNLDGSHESQNISYGDTAATVPRLPWYQCLCVMKKGSNEVCDRPENMRTQCRQQVLTGKHITQTESGSWTSKCFAKASLARGWKGWSSLTPMDF